MIPLQITFRDLDESDAVWLAVQERVDGLERFYHRIVSCEVVLSAPHRHHHRVKVFHVTVKLHIPGHDIFVSQEPELSKEHMNVYTAIGDAFDEIERQLASNLEKRRSFVKAKTGHPQGRVVRIFHQEGYGFILTPEGREIYFHENSVVGGKFQAIKIGQHVRFEEEQGEKGPQVTSMHLVGKKPRSGPNTVGAIESGYMLIDDQSLIMP